MHPPRTALALSASLLVVAGCGGSPRDPVLALLDELRAAAEDRSADRIRDRLSGGFRGQGGIDRPEAYAQVRRYFTAYETIDLEVYEVSVQRGQGGADVSFRVEFAGRARSIGGLDGLLPPGAVYRFDLHVVDQTGAWKVDRAAWEAVADPGPEG